VDDVLVSCVGQMAVTSASDLLWKSLVHEVLMQTRSEKVRTRILGLKIVKYLLDNLKEEFTVAIAETIPFLGELLEDVEPNVKSLAQEILRDMETATGEDLRQYL
ncbi:ARM repeat superfamily protein, partial [Tanacetum coccineum]